MKASCLINSHNYAAFIGEAIDSALHQTRAFDEIIVVDDGSTDGTVDLLRRRFSAHQRLRICCKPQGGQLSCFHRGLAETDADLLFFLDADDRYRPGMLAAAIGLYSAHPGVDFLSVGCREFGEGTPQRLRRQPTRDRGISAVGAALHRLWVGNPTSCLSVKADLARRILPYPKESDWQTRADDVLVFGASLAGAHKFHLEAPLVDYRIHDNNNFSGRSLTATDKMQYALRVDQLINWYLDQLGHDRASMSYLLNREFRTWQQPSLKELRSYLRMLGRAGLPWSARLEYAADMVMHYVKERRLAKSENVDILASGVPDDASVAETGGQVAGENRRVA